MRSRRGSTSDESTQDRMAKYTRSGASTTNVEAEVVARSRDSHNLAAALLRSPGALKSRFGQTSHEILTPSESSFHANSQSNGVQFDRRTVQFEPMFPNSVLERDDVWTQAERSANAGR